MFQDSGYVHKSDNVTVLLYHIASSAVYRRVVFIEEVDLMLLDACESMEIRYDFRFLEIGTDDDYVHFLVQSVKRKKLEQSSGSHRKKNVVDGSVPLQDLETGKRSSQCRFFKMKVLDSHKAGLINQCVKGNLDKKTTVLSDKVTTT
jgi:hypothetical protein